MGWAVAAWDLWEGRVEVHARACVAGEAGGGTASPARLCPTRQACRTTISLCRIVHRRSEPCPPPPPCAHDWQGGGAAEQAAGALMNLASTNAANQRAIIKAEALPKLVALLRDQTSNSRRCREYAAGALMNLTLKQPEMQDAVAGAGAIPLLVGMLREPVGQPANEDGSAAAQMEEVAGALTNLADTHEANQRAIGEAGAVPPLVAMLSAGSASAREEAAGTLMNLSAHEANKDSIAKAGAILPLVEALSAGEAGLPRPSQARTHPSAVPHTSLPLRGNPVPAAKPDQCTCGLILSTPRLPPHTCRGSRRSSLPPPVPSQAPLALESTRPALSPTCTPLFLRRHPLRQGARGRRPRQSRKRSHRPPGRNRRCRRRQAPTRPPRGGRSRRGLFGRCRARPRGGSPSQDRRGRWRRSARGLGALASLPARAKRRGSARRRRRGQPVCGARAGRERGGGRTGQRGQPLARGTGGRGGSGRHSPHRQPSHDGIFHCAGG